jgi:hypothetical protein
MQVYIESLETQTEKYTEKVSGRLPAYQYYGRITLVVHKMNRGVCFCRLLFHRLRGSKRILK